MTLRPRPSLALLLLTLLAGGGTVLAQPTVETFETASCGDVHACWVDTNARRITPAADEDCAFLQDHDRVLRTRAAPGRPSFAHTLTPRSASGVFSVAYFDDLGLCDAGLGAGEAEFAILTDNAAYPRSSNGLGVYTPTSPQHYAIRIDARHPQPTSVPRTFGWHELTFAWAQGMIVMSIDGTVVDRRPYPYAPDQFAVGNFWEYPHAAGGHWDDAIVLHV